MLELRYAPGLVFNNYAFRIASREPLIKSGRIRGSLVFDAICSTFLAK